MLKTNIKEKGFTIVELLIVIVIIGILGLLVLNTVTGAQKKARDAERQSDINAIATQLEVHYNNTGGYPRYAQIDTAAEAIALFKGLDGNALVAPNAASGVTSSFGNAASTGITNYGYVTVPASPSSDNVATAYTLSYTKEDGSGGIVNKQSLNN